MPANPSLAQELALPRLELANSGQDELVASERLLGYERSCSLAEQRTKDHSVERPGG